MSLASQVLLVPVLGSEGWTSIDLYLTDLLAGFAAAGSGAPGVLPVNPDRNAAWLRRQTDFYLGLPRLLRRELRRQTAQPLVHLLDHNYAYLCRFAQRSVVTCHDLAPLRVAGLKPHQLALFRARVGGMRRADAVVCVSAHTALDVADLLGIESARLSVNPLGVAAAFRQFAGARAASPAGFRILHVGSNEPRKNLPVLLEALALLRRRLPEARLLKVGPALAASPHAGLIRRLGLDEAVSDLGTQPLDRLVALYNEVDAFAFPSLYEGFGRPVLEAQACGTPCVIARATSLPEVGGSAALYHDPNDPAALAAALERVATEPELARSLAAAGQANAARFTWRAHAERLLEVYAGVAAAR